MFSLTGLRMYGIVSQVYGLKKCLFKLLIEACVLGCNDVF